MSGKPIVVLSEALWYKVSRLHQLAGHIEWSGPTWYTTEGDLNDPDEMKMFVSEFMLKDVGSGAYTEYEFGGEMIDHYTEHPELMQMPMGHLHTHHNMGVFFSGTDMQCLHDNAPVHEMFLSVIVNTSGDRIAKLAIVTEVEKKVSFKWLQKVFSVADKSKKQLTIYNCRVVIENDSEIIKNFEAVRKESEDRLATKYSKLPSEQKMLPVYNGKQGEIFKEVAGEDVFNELSEINIENLIVRSLAIDDTEAGTLGEVIVEVRESLPEGDQSDMIEMMIDHYEYSLRAEYHLDQFDTAISRSINLLGEYSGKYRFINAFIHKLRDLRKHYETSTGTQIRESENARGMEFDEFSYSYPAYTETEFENEF